MGGGSINDTYKLSAAGKTFFCKVNSAVNFPHLFAREKEGLEALVGQGKIQTPRLVDCFEAEGRQVLILEWVAEGERTKRFWTHFGKSLALLHQVSAEMHGWFHNNYMGSVPQSNTRHSTWCRFFREERLRPMVDRCAQKGLLQSVHLSLFEKFEAKLPSVFNEEKPALLHGDLWSGNFLCSQSGRLVLIDPAVYFGHRSVDMAMTALFGGFRQPFYDAYAYHFPLPSNYKEQWALCNLYPLLIHLYLFGSSYLAPIERTLKQFA